MTEFSDSFAGEGGAWRGYASTFGTEGFGVDVSAARLAYYPGPKTEVRDAVEFIVTEGGRFDLNHASPPCTGYSQATSAIPDRVARYGRLIPATRAALQVAGKPYVIENVVSKLTRAELRNPVMLCWTHFFEPGSVEDEDGTPLWMRRHRLFETSFPVRQPKCQHPPSRKGVPGFVQCAGAYGGARRDATEARTVRRGGYVPRSLDVMRRLLGTPWMSETGCQLSIPPAYSAYIAEEFLRNA